MRQRIVIECVIVINREAAPPRHMMDFFGTSSRAIAGQQQRQQARDPFQSMMMPFGGGMMMDPFQRMHSMFADFVRPSKINQNLLLCCVCVCVLHE